VSDGKRNNSTAVSTGFHIPGLFPTFPKVNVTNSKALNSGNAVENSAIGKDYLANILANGTKTTDIHPVFNEVIKFRLSDGTGAWWKADGSFIGLLEPYTK